MKNSDVVFCFCADGSPVKPGRKYFKNGHWNKGRIHPPEMIQKWKTTHEKNLREGKILNREGKTYEEIYGLERAEIERNKRAKSIKNVYDKKRKKDIFALKRVVETPPQTYCFCGCGDLANPNRRFIKGHSNIFYHKGKTYEEIYHDIEKAKFLKELRKKSTKELFQKKKKEGWISPNKGRKTYRKGLTYEQIYGPERAKEEVHKRIISSRDKSPYYFMGVPFDSNSERECAKLLYKKLGIILIDYVNCHFRVCKSYIDFYIYGIFIEFHPFNGHYENKTLQEYYEERRKLLDNNGYQKSLLSCIENLINFNKFLDFLKSFIGSDNVLDCVEFEESE